MIKNAVLRKRYNSIKHSGDDLEYINDKLQEIIALDIMLQRRAKEQVELKPAQRRYQELNGITAKVPKDDYPWFTWST